MSNPSSYYYYYGQPGTHLPDPEWAKVWQAQQHYATSEAYSRSGRSSTVGVYGDSSPPSPTSSQHSGYSQQQMRTQQSAYHGSSQGGSTRGYQQRSGRYTSYSSDSYASRHQQQQHWHRNQKYKRTRTDSGDALEPKSKGSKKKKKPLSQNVPSKKDWTLQEAEAALNVEKECNKRFKNQSLLIKFPDFELNKEIVAKFHPAIENVHFQQPSAPRFCFVTLNESADADAVISELNKQKIGNGYITAEYKKDREEDQNVGPEDIDPTTLYVGNLAQEITKEDMVKMYPRVRRIDIGYAKKMKYTRYAFVSFSSVADAIEAFKKTHSTQIYSKSLIVRFRRLHGPVGMPGETKQQNPPKNKDASESTTSEMNGCVTREPSMEPHITEETSMEQHITEDNNSLRGPPSPLSINSESLRSPQTSDKHSIKYEPDDSDDDDYYAKPKIKTEPDILNDIVNDAFANHKPKVKKEMKVEVKTEPTEEGIGDLQQKVAKDVESSVNVAQPLRDNVWSQEGPPRVKSESSDVLSEEGRNVIVKEEPDEGSESDSSPNLEGESFLGIRDFSSLYNSMVHDGSAAHKTG